MDVPGRYSMSALKQTTTSAPTRHEPGKRRSRRARRWMVLVALLSGAVLAFYAGGGWYFSGQIQDDLLDASDRDITYELTATAEQDGTVRVVAGAGDDLPDVLRTDAVYAIRSAEGSVVLAAAPVSQDSHSVVRRIARGLGTAYGGAPGATSLSPLAPETPVDLYREIWETPADIDRPFREISVEGPLGAMPAWFVPGRESSGNTWAIMVHGKGGTRAEPLRALTTASDIGLDALVITYRNDTDAPTTTPEQYGYGATEWLDLESAVRYALEQGAEDVVLFGFSLGGSIVAAFLDNSPLANDVAAVVLDSPMLDVKQTVYHGAAQRDLPIVGLPVPQSLAWSAMQISRLRFGSDWYDADYLDDVGWVDAPTLVFQGLADKTVPASTSRELAAQSSLVTLVEVEGAGHVESWNVDPDVYDSQLRDFLIAEVE